MEFQNQEIIKPRETEDKSVNKLKEIVLPQPTNLESLKVLVDTYGSNKRVDFEEMSGNPDVGTIRVLKQVHTIDNLSQDQEIRIGVCQAELLKILLEEKPKHLFVEGHEENIIDGDASSLVSSNALSLIERIKAEGKLPEELSDNDYIIISKEGAGLIYKIINSSSVIHPCISHEDSKQNEEDLQKFPEKRDEIVMDRREKFAINKIVSFLADNPGETAYLIYGAAHKWGPEDFPEESKGENQRPQIKSTILPGLNMASIGQSKLLELTEGYPELQKTLIDKSKSIDFVSLLGIKDEKNFSNAISKSSLEHPDPILIQVLIQIKEDNPINQRDIVERLSFIPAISFLHIKEEGLQRLILETKNIGGTSDDYLLGKTNIKDPALQFKFLNTSNDLNPNALYSANSDESKALSIIRSSSRFSVSFIEYPNITEEEVKKYVKENEFISPKVFPKLPSAELQLEALNNIIENMTKRERIAFGKDYFIENAKSEEVKQAIELKSNVLWEEKSIVNPSRNFSSIVDLVDELVLFDNSPEKQKKIIYSQKSIPVMALEVIRDPEVLTLAVDKMRPPSEIEKSGLNLNLMLLNNPELKNHLETILASINLSKQQEYGLFRNYYVPDQIKEKVIRESDGVVFDTLQYINSDDLLMLVLDKLEPPKTKKEYENAKLFLSPKTLEAFEKRFPISP